MDDGTSSPSAAPRGSVGGLFDSLRQLLAGLIALLQTRVELLTAELSAEVQRAMYTLLWACIALFFGGLSVLMLAFTVILAVGEEQRVLAAAIVAALFLALFIGAVLTVRTRLRNAPPLLAASLEELRRDAAALMPPERRGP